jgi:hypothetical protein
MMALISCRLYAEREPCDDAYPQSKLKAMVCAALVYGDLVIGITLEQYEAGLKEPAEEIRAEEAEKRVEAAREPTGADNRRRIS